MFGDVNKNVHMAQQKLKTIQIGMQMNGISTELREAKTLSGVLWLSEFKKLFTRRRQVING